MLSSVRLLLSPPYFSFLQGAPEKALNFVFTAEHGPVCPDHIPLPFKPGQLPLGKVSCIPLDNPDRFLQRSLAFQIRVQLLVPQPLHGG